MLLGSDTVLEVERISKLYSRAQSDTRQRLSRTFWNMLTYQSLPPVKALKSGEFWSLKDISFSLKRGEALGVIGFNGAGKTTLLRILSGQLLPDEGTIRMVGETAAMIDLTAGFQMGASGARNIYLRGAMLGRSREQMDASYDRIIDFAELGDAINAPVATYSSGMLMRLAFSIMVEMEPDILFIDEILAVGDFHFRQKCLARIRELREHTAFVLVSHAMGDVKLFCDRTMVLHSGSVAFEGDTEQAISLYHELQFPETPSPESKKSEILSPQYHNNDEITDIRHYWCDASGNALSEIRSGETLYFRLSFRANRMPRELVLGVPVWTENGDYVTGFSTELDDKKFMIVKGELNEFVLEIPRLSFNHGEYISNVGIADGPEFLYRGENPVLRVKRVENRSWGVVTLPHEWKKLT